jgi:hypothetical protein
MYLTDSAFSSPISLRRMLTSFTRLRPGLRSGEVYVLPPRRTKPFLSSPYSRGVYGDGNCQPCTRQSLCGGTLQERAGNMPRWSNEGQRSPRLGTLAVAARSSPYSRSVDGGLGSGRFTRRSLSSASGQGSLAARYLSHART